MWISQINRGQHSHLEAVNSASVEQFKIELDKVIDTLI